MLWAAMPFSAWPCFHLSGVDPREFGEKSPHETRSGVLQGAVEGPVAKNPLSASLKSLKCSSHQPGAPGRDYSKDVREEWEGAAWAGSRAALAMACFLCLQLPP